MADKRDARKKKIFKGLQDRGVTREDSLAILANIQHETGGSFNPSQKQKGGPAKGLIQWEGPRKRALEASKSPNSIDGQLDFLVQELNTSEQENFQKVQEQGTVEEKTAAFSQFVERPGKPHLESRLQAARDLTGEGVVPFRRTSEQTLGEPTSEEFNRQLTALPGIDEVAPEEIQLVGEDIANELIQKRGVASLGVKEGQAEAINKIQEADLPSAVKEQLKIDIQDPTKVVQGIERSKAQEAQGGQASVKDSFMEALTFFLPTVLGGAVGALIEGTDGFVAGADAGGSLGAAFRDHQFKQEELNLKKGVSGAKSGRQAEQDALRLARQKKQDALAEKRFGVSESQLEARQEEIKLQQKRSGNLQEDRGLRRDERDTDRAIKIKDTFAKRKDIIATKDTTDMLTSMEAILVDAPELAAGVIPFKVAKGLAGEVGNLTNEEREAAQISPSFFRKLKREGSTFFTGRLPEEDVTELRKALKVIANKSNENLQNKINGFVKSRGKNLKGDNQTFLLEDLGNENLYTGSLVGDKKSKSPSAIPSDGDIDNMNAEQLKAFLGE